MSDTDVYRLMWRYNTIENTWSDWASCPSRTHADGLYTSLRAATNSKRQQPHEFDYKIQKLCVAVMEASEYFHLNVERVELEWVDVDV